MKLVLAVAAIVFLWADTCASSASVPGSISYQGKLTNTLGQPVSDGAYQVQFRLYTVGTAGVAFWTSTPPQNVNTSAGVFTTQLSPLIASDLAGKPDVWMEILVGSPLTALSPRTKFTSVPFALISGDSWSLLGNAGITPSTNFIGTTDNQPVEFRVNNARALRLEPTTGAPNVIGGFFGNTVTAGSTGATISGGGASGLANSVTSNFGTVSGGMNNTVSGLLASIVGGYNNTASGSAATVGGGWSNTALGAYSFAAGMQAKANHSGAFVWADSTSADFASTAANQFLIRASGGVGIGANDPAAALDVNGLIRSRTGGIRFPDATIQTTAAWGLTGNAGTTPGTNFIGTTDNQPLEFRVNNTRGFRLEPTLYTPNIIGGYSGNTAASGVYGATISGGGSASSANNVTDHYGAVGGGVSNTVSGSAGTVGGGGANTASAPYATVGGGVWNTASAQGATVGGGDSNTAGGYLSTVPGGLRNFALGNYSFAAGNRATANYDGTFVWADSSDSEFDSSAPDQFLIRATGGVGIGVSDPAAALDVDGVIRSRTGGIKFPDATIQTTAAVTGSGTDNYLPRWSGTGAVESSAVYQADNGNVGIGVSDPAAALDVVGVIRSRSGGIKFPDATIQTTAAWGLTGNAGTTPGTSFIGTTDNQALEFRVNNTRGFRLEPTLYTPNVIGGYSGNTVTAGVSGATISGGGSAMSANSVTNHYGAVGGGAFNTASGYAGTIGGGSSNTASGTYATVPGGNQNTASGYYATIGGGFANTALGTYSVAAGQRAKANHTGAFVWADSTAADFASTANNQFLIRASGGVGINTSSPAYTLHVNGSVAGTSAYVNMSDLRYKTNIETISNPLDKVMKLRGVNFDWRKSEYPELAFGDGRQIGFVAQEIAQVLPEVVSKDNKGIYSVAYGSVVPVLVEAIKEQQKTIDELKARLAAIEAKTEKN